MIIKSIIKVRCSSLTQRVEKSNRKFFFFFAELKELGFNIVGGMLLGWWCYLFQFPWNMYTPNNTNPGYIRALLYNLKKEETGPFYINDSKSSSHSKNLRNLATDAAAKAWQRVSWHGEENTKRHNPQGSNQSWQLKRMAKINKIKREGIRAVVTFSGFPRGIPGSNPANSPLRYSHPLTASYCPLFGMDNVVCNEIILSGDRQCMEKTASGANDLRC